jgi:hypothetical protein
MRLIEARTLALHEFYGDEIPPYAILSHTWGKGEATFRDWEDLSRAKGKAGFAKIQGACAKAVDHGIDWVWVDTNCIDKSSSAELSEAINSMFDWYARSEVCYVYLGDVSSSEAEDREIGASRWWTRGWTLQELVAPASVLFYAADWSKIGSRNASLADLVSKNTGIDIEFLKGYTPVQRACVAQKMSWLAKRTTTRPEDMAYCMLGLFEINMPLLYGEGNRAFTRLQHEIIRTSNDHTIFCWTWTPSVPDSWTSLLAPTPSQFDGAGVFRPVAGLSVSDEVSIYSMTNAGLSIRLPVIYASTSYFIVLQAASIERSCDYPMLSCIQVRGHQQGAVLFVARFLYPRQPLNVAAMTTRSVRRQPLLIRNDRIMGRLDTFGLKTSGPNAETEYPGDFSLVVVFDTKDTREQWRLQEAMSYPYGAFDSLRGTLTLNVTNKRRRHMVGAALLTLTTRNMKTEMIIFVALEIMNGVPLWFCQIFAPQRDIMLDRNSVLQRLQKQVSAIPWEQPGHYSEALDLSVVMDSIHPLQQDHYNSFLRITPGRTTYLNNNSVRENDVDTDDSSTVDSAGSNIAIASSQRFGEWSVPTRGAFRVPEWEE